jgi:hypothetical protein
MHNGSTWDCCSCAQQSAHVDALCPVTGVCFTPPKRALSRAPTHSPLLAPSLRPPSSNAASGPSFHASLWHFLNHSVCWNIEKSTTWPMQPSKQPRSNVNPTTTQRGCSDGYIGYVVDSSQFQQHPFPHAASHPDPSLLLEAVAIVTHPGYCSALLSRPPSHEVLPQMCNNTVFVRMHYISITST